MQKTFDKHFKLTHEILTMANLTIFEPYLGNELVNQINSVDSVTVSVGILVLAVIIATVVLAFLKLITKQIAKRTETEFDDKLLEAAQQPIFRLIIIGGLYLAVLNLEVGSAIVDVILKFILTLVYLVVILFAVKIVGVLINYGLKKIASKTESSLDDEIIPIFHKAVVIVIWAFGLILVLGVWGVDVGPFLAGVGIAGLAISFALQSTLSNIFAGISLIIDKTFSVGDKVQLDSGEVGTIYEISLRSTRVKTYDNEILIIPNDALAKAKIKNYSQPDLKVRVVVPFSVEYGTDTDKVIKLVLSSVKKKMKGILPDPEPVVVFTEMGASSLNFEAKFWVGKYTDAYGKKLEAIDLIHSELVIAKIGIPFPTQTIYVKK